MSLIELSRKALYDLPTRKSVGTVCIANYYPDETDSSMSLPQRYYISSMTRWGEKSEDAKMSKWMSNAYRPSEKISAGQ